MIDATDTPLMFWIFNLWSTSPENNVHPNFCKLSLPGILLRGLFLLLIPRILLRRSLAFKMRLPNKLRPDSIYNFCVVYETIFLVQFRQHFSTFPLWVKCQSAVLVLLNISNVFNQYQFHQNYASLRILRPTKHNFLENTDSVQSVSNIHLQEL